MYCGVCMLSPYYVPLLMPSYVLISWQILYLRQHPPDPSFRPRVFVLDSRSLGFVVARSPLLVLASPMSSGIVLAWKVVVLSSSLVGNHMWQYPRDNARQVVGLLQKGLWLGVQRRTSRSGKMDCALVYGKRSRTGTGDYTGNGKTSHNREFTGACSTPEYSI